MRSLASVEQENQNLFTATALVLVQRTRTVVQILPPSVYLCRSPVRVIFDQAVELSLRADVRFDPESDKIARDAIYVAMGPISDIAEHLKARRPSW
jgi:hypothetical protein